MNTINTIREKQANLEREITSRQNEAIDIIIDKLFKYPIAMNSEHYKFLKEIETELREYKKNYL